MDTCLLGHGVSIVTALLELNFLLSLLRTGRTPRHDGVRTIRSPRKVFAGLNWGRGSGSMGIPQLVDFDRIYIDQLPIECQSPKLLHSSRANIPTYPLKIERKLGRNLVENDAHLAPFVFIKPSSRSDVCTSFPFTPGSSYVYLVLVFVTILPA